MGRWQAGGHGGRVPQVGCDTAQRCGVRGRRYATGSARTDEAAGERVGHAVGLDELRRLAEDLKANLESRLFRFGLGWVSGWG